MDFTDFLPEDYSADNEEDREDPTAESNKDDKKIISLPVAQPLGARTMTQVRKIKKRKETQQMHISEIQYHATREIWDVDYITTTDEEDNDSDPDDDKVNDAILKITPEGEQPAELPRAKKPVKKDVVRTLIEQDDELLTRDLQARLLKIKLWKLQRKKLDVPLSEEYDLNEDFSWINYEDDKDIHYLMGTKYKTSYRKGD